MAKEKKRKKIPEHFIPMVLSIENPKYYNTYKKYRVRQRGCSLTHSARTPPAVTPGITIWVDEIEIEKTKEKKNLARGFFFGGGGVNFF